MKNSADNSRGMALLITLTVITLMIAGALELNRRVRAAVEATASARDRQTLTQMAYAGVQVAMAMLIKDKKESATDSIQEDWADPGKIAEVLQEIPLEKGRMTFSITDELGKIQINALVNYKTSGNAFNLSQQILWEKFFEQFIYLIKESDKKAQFDYTPKALTYFVKDWIDSDDDGVDMYVAESDYYKGLDPPYAAANSPFRHINEILQVRGVGELFDSITGSNNSDNIKKIGDFVTVYGIEKAPGKSITQTFSYPGKININTAPIEVIKVIIPGENDEYAQAIFDYRNEKEDDNFVNTDLASPTWYKNVPDIPGDLQIDPNLITVSSDIFRIKATSNLNDMQMNLDVVVEREQAKNGKWTCRILSWQTE